MHTGSHGVMWVKSLLSELKVRINDSVFIHEDNQSAIAIAKNHGYQMVKTANQEMLKRGHFSAVWEDFEEYKSPEGDLKAKCNKFSAVLSFKTGTSTIIKHYKKHKADTKGKTRTDLSLAKPSQAIWKYDQNVAYEKLIEMIFFMS
ncbi:hypothetical protein ABG067_005371 [Albugo candida]